MHLAGRRIFTGIVHDLTARVQAEIALAQLNQRHKLILDSAGEGIYGIDQEGRTTFVNPAAARMLGREVEDLIGQPMQDIVCHTMRDGTPCSHDACPILASCRDGVVQHVSEDVFWRQDGTSFLVEYVSTPIREHDTLVGAVVIFKDITERKRLEQEMQITDRMALVGQLASGLAHEIGTPLNIVAGNAELLRMDLREHGLGTAEVDAIIQHADRITRLTLPDSDVPVRGQVIAELLDDRRGARGVGGRARVATSHQGHPQHSEAQDPHPWPLVSALLAYHLPSPCSAWAVSAPSTAPTHCGWSANMDGVWLSTP
jgi:PAS domain S-box-containing protein